MSEISQSSENLKIPENWQFPERHEPGLKVLVIIMCITAMPAAWHVLVC